jgi:hypothetical protein
MNAGVKKKDLVTFALIWALIFFAIGLYPLIRGADLRVWSLVVAILFILISLIRPTMLKNFYVIWVKIGEFIGGIVSRVIMFILYFGLFTPVAFMLKVLRKDLLGKKIDDKKTTYWVTRDSQPQSMKNQF